MIIAIYRFDIGLQPLKFCNLPPVYFVASVDNNVLKEKALRSAIAIAEGMDNVQIPVEFSGSYHEIFSAQSFEPACTRQSQK